MLLYSLILAVISINTNVNGGPTCSSMEPMCTFDGLSFSAVHHDGSFAATGPFYKCLSTQPDPAWFYLEISTAGDIHMKLEAAHDIDFIIYGPYSDKASAQGKCGTLGNPSDEVTDCSFLPTQIESVDIFNATVGEVYVMLITNYAKVTQDISLVSLSMSTGATDCAIVPTKNPTTVTSAPTALPSTVPTPTPTEATLPPTAEKTKCEYDKNYFFHGNQVHATGDPHFQMWNSDYHDYQGVGPVSNQYYYITRNNDSTSIELPFNMLGRHYYWTHGASIRGLDYITLELFDTNGDYYLIFLQTGVLKYTTNAVPTATSTLFDNIDAALLSEFDIGQPISIGNIFTAEVTSNTNNIMNFTLNTAGCHLTLNMRAMTFAPSTNGRYFQDLYVNPPNCWQCFITGLFGDFKRRNVSSGPNYEGRLAEMPLCNGGYQDIKAGWSRGNDPLVTNTAYDQGGLSYLKSKCSRGKRRRLGLADNSYVVEAPVDFVYIDACPSGSEIAQLTAAECSSTRNEYDTTICAHDEMKNICNTLQLACEYDACALVNGDKSKIATAVENVFGNNLGFLQSVPGIIDLYNPKDVAASPNAPTTPPVPTHEPTPRPTEVSILVQLKDKADNGSMYVGIGIGIGITCVFCICFGLVLYFAAIKPKISSHQYVQANVVSDTGTENLNLI